MLYLSLNLYVSLSLKYLTDADLQHLSKQIPFNQQVNLLQQTLQKTA